MRFLKHLFIYLFCPPYRDGTETKWGTITGHYFDWNTGEYWVTLDTYHMPVTMGLIRYWEKKYHVR